LGSLIENFLGGLWNMLRKGVGLAKSNDILDGLKQHNLPNQCVYLLLILINHCTTGGGGNTVNPYREAMITFGNDAGKPA